jgi:hypothetical protein
MFDSESPFAIRDIARTALPLLTARVRDSSIGNAMAFNSGLTVVKQDNGTNNGTNGSLAASNSQVIFAYGSSNVEARMLVMSMDDVKDLFLNSSISTSHVN